MKISGFRKVSIGALPLLAGISGGALSQTPGRVTLCNDQPFARSHEMIRLERSQLGGEKGKRPTFFSEGHTLPSQFLLDPTRQEWTAVLLSVDLPAKSKRTYKVKWVTPVEIHEEPVRADVRLSLRSETGSPTANIPHETRQRGFVQNISKPKYQMEGPGIENDQFAMRVFFDQRNGKDLYGKLGEEPVLERVGLGGSWHKLQPWGMDILKTGDSISMEGLAVKQGSEVVRLADADVSMFDALYSGPLQAALQLKFQGWDVGTAKRDGAEIISMSVGDSLYQDAVTVPLSSGQELITGLPNFDKRILPRHTVHNGQISSISTYGPQAEGTGTALGLAIFFPTADFVQTQSTDADPVLPHSHLVTLHPHGGTEVFTVAVCWEKRDPQFATEAGFQSYLQRVADHLAHPIRVRVH